SAVGQSVTFTATVASTAGTPGGTVTFMEGAATLGTGNLNGSGVATFGTSSLATGPHTITAVYGASGNFAGSTSNTLTQTVAAATSTALTSSLNPSTVGQAVTFTATVTSGAGTPTGSATITIDGGCVGT